jgi:hypothetical protein
MPSLRRRGGASDCCSGSCQKIFDTRVVLCLQSVALFLFVRIPRRTALQLTRERLAVLLRRAPLVAANPAIFLLFQRSQPCPTEAHGLSSAIAISYMARQKGHISLYPE